MSDEKKNDFAVEMGEKGSNGNFEARDRPVSAAPAPAAAMSGSTMSVLAYCGSSILMTTTNKYVLTGTFNLNFFLLCIQVMLSG